MHELTREQTLKSVIALAERLLLVPDCPLPHCWSRFGERIFCHDPETYALAVKTVGSGRKDNDKDSLLFYPEQFPTVVINGFKYGICERVVVGVKEVPAMVIPAQPAVEERVIPAYTEEVVEWHCKPFTAPRESETATEVE